VLDKDFTVPIGKFTVGILQMLALQKLLLVLWVKGVAQQRDRGKARGNVLLMPGAGGGGGA